MRVNIAKRKTDNNFFPKKAKVIFIFEDGTVIHGDGQVDGRKPHKSKEAIFTATLIKSI